MIILGSINYGFSVTSNQYVTERIRSLINTVDSSMTEYGFLNFYRTLSTFVTKFRLKQIFKDENDDEEYALTMEHFKIPFITSIYLSLIVFATIVFFY